MIDYNIRKALLSDLSHLYNCNKSILPIYYSLFDWMSMLLDNNFLIHVATNTNNNDPPNFIGYVLCRFDTNNLHILSFGIYPIFRRQKIGSRLIDSICSLTSSDISNLTLYVHIENLLAIKFYQNNHFLVTKHLTNYYKNFLKNVDSQDAYLMTRVL